MSENKKVVLLIDDDDDYLIQQRIHLEDAGYTVLTANNAKDALNMFSTKKPDIVFVDLIMENMNSGFSLTYQFLNQEQTKQKKRTPIVMVTSATRDSVIDFDPQNAEERKWVHADEVISKPVKPEQLIREIKRLVK